MHQKKLLKEFCYLWALRPLSLKENESWWHHSCEKTIKLKALGSEIIYRKANRSPSWKNQRDWILMEGEWSILIKFNKCFELLEGYPSRSKVHGHYWRHTVQWIPKGRERRRQEKFILSWCAYKRSSLRENYKAIQNVWCMRKRQVGLYLHDRWDWPSDKKVDIISFLHWKGEH